MRRSTDETIEALTSGVAEIGLILNPPARESITRTEVFRDTIVAAVAPTHPLVNRKIVSLRELVGFRFVLTEKAFGLRQQIDRTFDRCGLKPDVYCVTNSLALVKGIVSAGRECALMPRCSIEHEVRTGSLCSITVKEFAGDPWVFCVCASSARSLSPAAKVFTDAIVDYCRRYRK